MRAKICDVCEEPREEDFPMLYLEVPPFMIKQEGEEMMPLDVCSWGCMAQIVKAYNPVKGPEPDPEAVPPPSEPEAEKTITFHPAESQHVEPMSPQELAEYTEYVTGVRRR